MHIYLCFTITISNDLFGNSFVSYSAQNSKLEQFRHNEQSENLYAAPADGLMELHEVLQTMPSSLCCVHKLEIQFASSIVNVSFLRFKFNYLGDARCTLALFLPLSSATSRQMNVSMLQNFNLKHCIAKENAHKGRD